MVYLSVGCSACAYRAASQLGDNYSPIVGPGLPPGDTVSSYIERVSMVQADVLVA